MLFTQWQFMFVHKKPLSGLPGSTITKGILWLLRSTLLLHATPTTDLLLTMDAHYQTTMPIDWTKQYAVHWLEIEHLKQFKKQFRTYACARISFTPLNCPGSMPDRVTVRKNPVKSGESGHYIRKTAGSTTGWANAEQTKNRGTFYLLFAPYT